MVAPRSRWQGAVAGVCVFQLVAMGLMSRTLRPVTFLFATSPGWSCLNAHVDTTLAYLVDDLGCDLDKKNGDGDAPLHVAVTWGRPEVADYLLSRGAFFAAKDADGLTPREAAHRRQSLLESGDPAYVARCVEKGMDIPGLREGGKALCKLLDGVTAAGSYAKFTAARQ